MQGIVSLTFTLESHEIRKKTLDNNAQYLVMNIKDTMVQLIYKLHGGFVVLI